jgi:hypothetical protein
MIMRMSKASRCLWALLAILCCFSSKVFATDYALLVGVSEYPNLAPELWLKGPVNDVRRAQQMLLGQGVDGKNIMLLADGIETAELPTKANIVAKMQALANTVAPGDFVYLHFSGHGSQQPSMDFATEVDGLDEIFLPRDVSGWDQDAGTVLHALSDDEVAVLVNKIRDKGADVWLIFDSCHAGTMSRSVTASSVKMRNVDPGALGIPSAQLVNKTLVNKAPDKITPLFTSEASGMAPAKTSQRGSLVAFYAAQSSEEAPEMALPAGDKEVSQGLFSYVLTSMVSRYPNISYTQLAQVILLNYNSLPWLRTTPLFEGENLDTPLFKRESAPAVRVVANVSKRSIGLKAGVLQGFENGALVTLYPDPVSHQRLAQGRVLDAELTSAKLTLSEPLAAATYYAELAQPALPPSLKVKWLAQPPSNWLASQGALASHALLSRTIEWVETDQHADIGLYAGSKALYVFTGQDTLPCALPVAVKSQCSDDSLSYKNQPLGLSAETDVLTSVLVRTVRALNLLRLSARMPDLGTITNFVMRQQPGQSFEPLSLEQEIRLRDGDTLRAEFVNTSAQVVDLTILFIDSQFGITQIYPEPGTSGRLNSGEMTDFEGTITATTIGNEEFVIIATPVSRDGPATNLLHLQQPALNSSVFTRGAGYSDDLFSQALGDAPQSRGFSKKSSNESKASISVVRWLTQP